MKKKEILDYFKDINYMYNNPNRYDDLKRMINELDMFDGAWIPVAERVPGEYGEYMITWTTSMCKKELLGIAEYEITSEWDCEKNRFKGNWIVEEYINNYPDVEVIAWMPLPEPYRAESEE